MGRWLWDVGNELIRGETGWSTFEEREAKAMMKWMLRVVCEENMVSEQCLLDFPFSAHLSTGHIAFSQTSHGASLQGLTAAW